MYAENLDDHYAEVARHYTHAGDAEQAIVYLQLAAQFAIQRSVSEEAVVHLTQALAQLDNIEDAEERARTELELQLALSGALMNKGWANPGIEDAFSRAHELCLELGETKQLFSVLIGSFAVTAVSGSNWATARGYADELLRLAEEEGDDDLRVLAHFALTMNKSFYRVSRLRHGRAHAHYSACTTPSGITHSVFLRSASTYAALAFHR